jgi:hypothetical protein
MLWLRWFAVGAAVANLPYYLSQTTVLWPPVIWGVVFLLINLHQIARIYLDRVAKPACSRPGLLGWAACEMQACKRYVSPPPSR